MPSPHPFALVESLLRESRAAKSWNATLCLYRIGRFECRLFGVPDSVRIEIAPVGLLRHHGLEGTNAIRYGILADANDLLAFLKSAHSIDHAAPKLDDCEIAGTQPLARAICNGSHAHPHGEVLVWEPPYPGEIARLHRLAILHEAILECPQRSIFLVQIHADCLTQELAPSLGFRGLRRLTPGDE